MDRDILDTAAASEDMDIARDSATVDDTAFEDDVADGGALAACRSHPGPHRDS